VTPADLEALATIKEELDILTVQSRPAKTIYVLHSPPYATALDRLTDGRPVGSRAVRAFIEQHRPPLTLHGHIHESPIVSGHYANRIGRTLCVNPGQMAQRLHVVIFDTKDPDATMRPSWMGLNRAMEPACALCGWISIPLQARNLQRDTRYAGIRRLWSSIARALCERPSSACRRTSGWSKSSRMLRHKDSERYWLRRILKASPQLHDLAYQTL
jgi:hypothetical protein